MYRVLNVFLFRTVSGKEAEYSTLPLSCAAFVGKNSKDSIFFLC